MGCIEHKTTPTADADGELFSGGDKVTVPSNNAFEAMAPREPLKTPVERDGKPVWPARFPREEIERRRQESGTLEFARMYLLDLEADPSPLRVCRDLVGEPESGFERTTARDHAIGEAHRDRLFRRHGAARGDKQTVF